MANPKGLYKTLLQTEIIDSGTVICVTFVLSLLLLLLLHLLPVLLLLPLLLLLCLLSI